MRKKIGLLSINQGAEQAMILNWLRQFGNVTVVLHDEQDTYYYDCLVIAGNSLIPMPTPADYHEATINPALEFFQANHLDMFINEKKMPIFGIGTGALLLWKFLKGGIDANPWFNFNRQEDLYGCITTFTKKLHGETPLYNPDHAFGFYQVKYDLPQIINVDRRKIPDKVKVVGWRTPLSKGRYKDMNFSKIKEGSEVMLEPLMYYHIEKALAGTASLPYLQPNVKGSRSYREGYKMGDPVSNHLFNFFLYQNTLEDEGVMEPARL